MDDGHDDGGGSVGSRVLWLILHAFILIMSLFMVTVYNVFRACWTFALYWTSDHGEPRRAILLANSVWPAAFVCRAIGRR